MDMTVNIWPWADPFAISAELKPHWHAIRKVNEAFFSNIVLQKRLQWAEGRGGVAPECPRSSAERSCRFLPIFIGSHQLSWATLPETNLWQLGQEASCGSFSSVHPHVIAVELVVINFLKLQCDVWDNIHFKYSFVSFWIWILERFSQDWHRVGFSWAEHVSGKMYGTISTWLQNMVCLNKQSKCLWGYEHYQFNATQFNLIQLYSIKPHSIHFYSTQFNSTQFN